MEGIANETDIRKERGLSDSEPDSERGAGTGTDQVRTDEEEFSEGTQERNLSGNDTDRGAESTLSAGTGAGRAENGTSDRTDGEVGGSERGIEISRSDGLGSEDEQHQTLSGGNRADRTDLHLSSEEQANITMQEPDSDSNSLSGSFSDKTEDFTELQKGILGFDNHLIHKRPEIAGYFQSEQDAVLQTEYLKNSFRMEEFTELYIGDVRAGYRADEDGLTMWKGNYLTREAESRLSWEDARYWVNSYIEDGVYLLPGEVAEQIDTDGMFKQLDLFTMFSEQVGNIAMKQAEEKSVMPTGFVLPEQQIDDILRSGGGRDDSRKRIYAKYQQRKTPEEMTAFLKKEYSQFEKIPLSQERQVAIIERQIDEIELAIAQAKADNGERYTIKQMEKSRKSLLTRLEKLNDASRKDNVVTFEQLGVDRLFVDESHNYKNLFLYTNMRYLQYGTLQKLGLGHFDSWASSFGETQTAIELAPEGTGYRAKTRFAKFFNLPELIALFKESADIQTPDMLNLPVPEAEYENVVLKPSEYQQDMVASLAERAEAVRDRQVQAYEDNMLPDDENSKVSTCVEKAFEILEQTKEQKSTQLIFCDLSTPKGDGTFNVYDDIRNKLIEKGVPPEEIAFIHEANTELRKAELFGKVRSGQIRFLLGSTQKMGDGTNVQDRLIALHHLDVPWRPSDIEQQEGRILRQGNLNPKVKIFRYVT